ncbi:MAG TPA: glycosyltransferase family 39 protein, partial [Vicinamibacterales bacterium]|nr:glycosyltransferase family 39 protein [Vicinamibacterales bacterium]
MQTAVIESTSRAAVAIPKPWIIGIALAGLLIRLAVLAQTSALDPKIEDERQYVRLATSLVRGDGFAWAPGEPTSLRPPLYPALIAALWHVTGEGQLQPIRAVHVLLSLLTAAFVYAIGRRVWNARVGAIGAAIAWLDPTAIYLNSTILTETLFTALLVAFVLATVMVVQTRTRASALICGLALGLGALTRSVLWPVPLLLCPLLLVLVDDSWRRRLSLAAIVFAGYALVVAPWAVRNTRLQQVTTIVDTMGGMNLRMGNYEYTPEDRMWDAVSMKGEKNWVYALTVEGHPSGDAITEGEKDKWAQAKAIAYMKANPGRTLRRSIIKFTDFWGLERSFIAGVQQGLYRVPMAVAAVVAILMLVS